MADDFSRQLAKASAELRAMSRDVRKGVRPAIKDAAEPMVTTAKSNASWSSRIPAAIRMSTIKQGVDIRVSRAKAPHARPYEGARGNATFRHPTHGHRDRWVSQQTRPFLGPAVKQHRPGVRRGLIDVVDEAAKRHGYR